MPSGTFFRFNPKGQGHLFAQRRRSTEYPERSRSLILTRCVFFPGMAGHGGLFVNLVKTNIIK
jgi:hypothetical protein